MEPSAEWATVLPVAPSALLSRAHETDRASVAGLRDALADVLVPPARASTTDVLRMLLSSKYRGALCVAAARVQRDVDEKERRRGGAAAAAAAPRQPRRKKRRRSRKNSHRRR